MIAISVFLVLLALGGVFGCGMLLGHQRALKAHVCPVPVVFPLAPANRLHELALERIRVRDERIAFLESIEVVPVSPYMELPWQVVPSPARTFWVQGLVDRIQDLEAEVAELEDLALWKDSLRARYLARWKAAQRKLRASVPVESLAAVEDLRTRSLSVAKSAATRAAELSTAITELEIARFAALDLDTFNTQCDLILDRHSPVLFPSRERTAA